MPRVSHKQRRKINGGKYHWKLQKWANNLLINNPECIVCGSKEKLEAHHITRVKPYDERYIDEENGVVLCRKCHNKYHEEYNQINPVTLIKFTRENGVNKKLIKENKKLRRQKKKLKHKIQNQKVNEMGYASLKWRQKHENN